MLRLWEVLRPAKSKSIPSGQIWLRYATAIVADLELLIRQCDLYPQTIKGLVFADSPCAIHAVIHEVSHCIQQLDASRINIEIKNSFVGVA